MKIPEFRFQISKRRRRWNPKVETIVGIIVVLILFCALTAAGVVVIGLCLAWGRYANGL